MKTGIVKGMALFTLKQKSPLKKQSRKLTGCFWKIRKCK